MILKKYYEWFRISKFRRKRIVKYFFKKEYLKHWNQAYHNIDLKKWPNFLKILIENIMLIVFLTRIKKLFKIYE